jgi:uncharacterized integral membrane protein
LAKLKKRVEALGGRSDHFMTGDTSDHIHNRRTRFQEYGNWARHYSTVRMTVTTFLVSLSVGILSFKWDPNDGPPADLFINLSGGVWIVALCLFLIFTHHTYRQMAHARRLRNRLETGDEYDKTKRAIHPRKNDWASWILIILSAVFGLLLLCLALANIQQGTDAMCLPLRVLVVPILVLLVALLAGAYTICQTIPDDGTAKAKETH